MAPLALTATTAACVAVMVKESLDAEDPESCYANHNVSLIYSDLASQAEAKFTPNFPTERNFKGFGEGLCQITIKPL